MVKNAEQKVTKSLFVETKTRPWSAMVSRPIFEHMTMFHTERNTLIHPDPWWMATGAHQNGPIEATLNLKLFQVPFMVFT